MKELETLKLYRGATSVIELDFTGFNFESNSYCQLTIKKKYNDDIVFQHDFNKSIKYYVTFKDEFTAILDDDKYEYDIMYILKDERYPQCSISDIVIDEVVNDYKGEFNAEAVQVTEVLTEGAEITQTIKVTTSNVIIASSNLQERTVIPTKEEQVVLAEDGFDGMSKVVVEAIPSDYVIPNLQEKEARVTAPTNIFVHPDEGYDGLAFVNVIAGVDTEQVEVTPTKEEQVLTPSEKTYFDSVTINPIPYNFIEPSGELEINENGSYDVVDKAGVNVDIQPNLGTKTITENGVYNASDDNLDGYSSVEVETSGADLNEYFNLDVEITGANASSNAGYLFTLKKIPAVKNTGITCRNIFFGFKGEEIDLSKFDTTNVTDMYAMFCNCSNLKNLDVKNFKTSNVNTMYNMFQNCSSLTELDLNNFNTGNVTAMNNMFNTCNKLTRLNLNDWDTSKVTNMQSMFAGCSNLSELDLSSFTSNSCTNTSTMFNSCTKLAKIDIRNFDFSTLTSYTNMFGASGGMGVPNSCEIIVKDNTAKEWVTSNFNRLTNVKTVAELGA